MKIIPSSLLTTTLLALLPNLTWAGQLAEVYQKNTIGDPGVETADYLLQAAQQDVITEKRNYLPKVMVEAKQLYVGQDIDQSGAGVFQQGWDDYSNTRAKLEIDQPLVDFTLKHRVQAAEAMRDVRDEVLRKEREELVQRLLNTYLEAARFTNLENSLDRVITRLEEESDRVSKNFEEQLATVEDVEKVKSALAAMRQEKRAFQEQVRFRLFELGLDPLAPIDHQLAESIDLALPEAADSAADMANPQISALQSEVTAYGSQMAAVRADDLPRLSLYGLYEYDDAGGSEFGGERTMNNYQVGVAVRWDVFDRGIHRSQAMKLRYLKLAKEAELRAVAAKAAREADFARLSVDLAKASLINQEQLVQHQEAIRQASEASYREGGDTTYINMLNAFLLHESQVRQLINSRFDYIAKQAKLKAIHLGWDQDLILEVDGLFVAAE